MIYQSVKRQHGTVRLWGKKSVYVLPKSSQFQIVLKYIFVRYKFEHPTLALKPPCRVLSKGGQPPSPQDPRYAGAA